MLNPDDPLPQLERLVQRHTGSPEPLSATQMPGGASTRRFFRVNLKPSSAVAMVIPDAAQPEELAKTDESGRRWPFLEVRELLEARGIRVPRLLAEACNDGLLLVEDLGDDTLATYLTRVPEQRERLYQAAIADVARAQQQLRRLPEGSIVATRSFDRDLLRWEIDHFREWGLEGRGIELTAAERAEFALHADYLADTIASWPRGFVHRDYQSQNLMVLCHDGGRTELVWIDFQDALLGPRVYDLVALLNDSYQSLERPFIEARLDEYAGCLGLDRAEREAIGREFDLVTVQRKLKDAGRFVFIDRVKGNPRFLQFVEPTIEKVRRALDRLRDDHHMLQLARLLARLV
jgi:aminoglycoside/choline kinase family phosphotransferase